MFIKVLHSYTNQRIIYSTNWCKYSSKITWVIKIFIELYISINFMKNNIQRIYTKYDFLFKIRNGNTIPYDSSSNEIFS